MIIIYKQNVSDFNYLFVKDIIFVFKLYPNASLNKSQIKTYAPISAKQIYVLNNWAWPKGHDQDFEYEWNQESGRIGCVTFDTLPGWILIKPAPVIWTPGQILDKVEYEWKQKVWLCNIWHSTAWRDFIIWGFEPRSVTRSTVSETRLKTSNCLAGQEMLLHCAKCAIHKYKKTHIYIYTYTNTNTQKKQIQMSKHKISNYPAWQEIISKPGCQRCDFQYAIKILRIYQNQSVYNQNLIINYLIIK